MVKNLHVIRETRVQSLGQEDHLQKGMATYSSIAWKIPLTEAWQATSMGSQKSWT